MITLVSLTGFKNFDFESLRVGPFTVLVGANASGKSNIRDAFRFICGIGRGYTIAEIVGGKHIGGRPEWEPIRGAPHEIAKTDVGVFTLGVKLTLENLSATYLIGVGSEVLGASGPKILTERFCIEDRIVFERDDGGLRGQVSSTLKPIEHVFRKDQPMVAQLQQVLPNTIFGKFAALAVDTFANIRFLDLVPDNMREPSFPGQNVIGDSGEHLATVLKALCADTAKKEVLTQWTRELTPMDVKDFDFREGPDGKIHLILQEMNGKEISAQSASDGTLRFLAMLAALLGPNPARLYFFEEIDNGIHPSRLHLLIDLIERQTAKGQTQVIATTHSPDLLTMIGDTTFENTSVVCRLEDTEDAIIRPVADLPNARKLRTDQGLGRLLAGGWMEDALTFTEENEDPGMDSE